MPTAAPTDAQIVAQLEAVRMQPDMALSWQLKNVAGGCVTVVKLEFSLRTQDPARPGEVTTLDLARHVRRLSLDEANDWQAFLKVEVEAGGLELLEQHFTRWFEFEPITLLRAV